jgi:hypothetical protein
MAAKVTSTSGLACRVEETVNLVKFEDDFKQISFETPREPLGVIACGQRVYCCMPYERRLFRIK